MCGHQWRGPSLDAARSLERARAQADGESGLVERTAYGDVLRVRPTAQHCGWLRDVHFDVGLSTFCTALPRAQLTGDVSREPPHLPAVVGSTPLAAMAGGFFVQARPRSGWSEQEMHAFRTVGPAPSRSRGDSEAVCTAWTAAYLETLAVDPPPGIPGAWLYDQAVRARAAADDAACAGQRPRQDPGDDPGSDDSGDDAPGADDPDDRFLDRLAQPAGSYGVDAAERSTQGAKHWLLDGDCTSPTKPA